MTFVAKQFRVFRLFYLCDHCPHEWEETSMVVGPAFCPHCDAACEPYDTEALLEDVAEETEQ